MLKNWKSTWVHVRTCTVALLDRKKGTYNLSHGSFFFLPFQGGDEVDFCQMLHAEMVRDRNVSSLSENHQSTEKSGNLREVVNAHAHI